MGLYLVPCLEDEMLWRDCWKKFVEYFNFNDFRPILEVLLARYALCSMHANTTWNACEYYYKYIRIPMEIVASDQENSLLPGYLKQIITWILLVNIHALRSEINLEKVNTVWVPVVGNYTKLCLGLQFAILCGINWYRVFNIIRRHMDTHTNVKTFGHTNIDETCMNEYIKHTHDQVNMLCVRVRVQLLLILTSICIFA